MTEAGRGRTRAARFRSIFTKRPGIRIRILLIALIPSLTLLSIGVGAAVYLVRQGQQEQNFAQTVGDSIANNQAMASAVEQERLLAIWQVAGTDPDPVGLATARQRLDDALRALLPDLTAMEDTGADALQEHIGDFEKMRSQLAMIRTQVDAGTMPIPDVYLFYTAMLSGFEQTGIELIEGNVPSTATAVELTVNLELLRAVEAMSRSSALTAAVINGAALAPALATELRDLVGYYHTMIGQVATKPTPEGQLAKRIIETPAWQRLSAIEDAIIDPASTKSGTPAPLPLTAREWRDAATEVNQQLLDLWGNHGKQALERSALTARDDSRDWTIAGAAVFGLALVAFLVALWLANRLIGRLRRLRAETLALAEVRLPETMRRLDAGADTDTETEAARLDFGSDEIGSVATAFNRAYAAAVTAAIGAARTRDGVRAVFLNIAHRSQIVVHRQLEILDEAESRQEDPKLLETFFRLDHLATRERRNAENLIVLGGGQPVRQWRRPVALLDIVRSAIGETLDYARVHNGRLPHVLLIGSVVADLIHLLAELVDNATTFSPPQSRVEVTGNLAGKGVIVEISDQGMGMTPEELARANEMLRNAPDFGVTTLSEDSRLGLFVVARLGARHDISTRLTESDYGGVRAIVLIPNALVAADAPDIDATPIADRLLDHIPSHRPYSPPSGPLPIAGAAPAPAVAAVSQLDPAPVDGPRRYGPDSIVPARTDPRPALPRRRRQENLSPELAHQFGSESGPRHARSAESARDLMSAIEIGTRQGRQATPDPDPAGPYPAIHPSGEQEGDGDHFQRR